MGAVEGEKEETQIGKEIERETRNNRKGGTRDRKEGRDCCFRRRGKINHE